MSPRSLKFYSIREKREKPASLGPHSWDRRRPHRPASRTTPAASRRRGETPRPELAMVRRKEPLPRRIPPTAHLPQIRHSFAFLWREIAPWCGILRAICCEIPRDRHDVER